MESADNKAVTADRNTVASQANLAAANSKEREDTTAATTTTARAGPGVLGVLLEDLVASRDNLRAMAANSLASSEEVVVKSMVVSKEVMEAVSKEATEAVNNTVVASSTMEMGLAMGMFELINCSGGI